MFFYNWLIPTCFNLSNRITSNPEAKNLKKFTTGVLNFFVPTFQFRRFSRGISLFLYQIAFLFFLPNLQLHHRNLIRLYTLSALQAFLFHKRTAQDRVLKVSSLFKYSILFFINLTCTLVKN